MFCIVMKLPLVITKEQLLRKPRETTAEIWRKTHFFTDPTAVKTNPSFSMTLLDFYNKFMCDLMHAVVQVHAGCIEKGTVYHHLRQDSEVIPRKTFTVQFQLSH